MQGKTGKLCKLELAAVMAATKQKDSYWEKYEGSGEKANQYGVFTLKRVVGQDHAKDIIRCHC